MKIIKYLMNDGTEKEIRCPSASLEENLAIAKEEAQNGEYTIEDDSKPEPEVQQTPEERIAELEQALEMLLSGVTE